MDTLLEAHFPRWREEVTLSENIYELVLMCVIYGCLVALRKVLSNRNKEERGTISKAGGPPDADRGISGGERQEPSQAKGTDVMLGHDLQ